MTPEQLDEIEKRWAGYLEKDEVERRFLFDRWWDKRDFWDMSKALREARAEVERLTSELARERDMRLMAERFHDCAVADRNAARAQLTMLKLDQERPLPCPFQADGKHRCGDCGLELSGA